MSAADMNKKINDCKIKQDFIDKMYDDFMKFCKEVENEERKKRILESEIIKLYESLENKPHLSS